MGLVILVCILLGPEVFYIFQYSTEQKIAFYVYSDSAIIYWKNFKSHKWHLTDVTLSLLNKMFGLHHLYIYVD